jgi:hypothetical protein
MEYCGYIIKEEFIDYPNYYFVKKGNFERLGEDITLTGIKQQIDYLIKNK